MNRTRMIPAGFLTMILLAGTAFAGAGPAQEVRERPRDPAASLRNLLNEGAIPPSVVEELEAAIDETAASTGDGALLRDAALRTARTLGREAARLDRSFFDGFTEGYAALLQEAAETSDWKIDLEPYPLHECDGDFNCVWARSIYCLRVIWTGPDGSGGVNCITANPGS